MSAPAVIRAANASATIGTPCDRLTQSVAAAATITAAISQRNCGSGMMRSPLQPQYGTAKHDSEPLITAEAEYGQCS